ncbi:MAG: signal peptidase I [Gammaproteobacteria bacterium]|nr:signal peptidase I [Gammaproteobacteria bacterium]MDH5591976.1 signal peptidase I [Gammaproteobacteria bacterium]
MSFPALMVTLVAVTGIIWLIDTVLWAPQRAKDQKEPLVVEYARSFFPIILVVLVIRSFLAEPFRIPSGSMLPTLHIGDFILVNKFAYGIRLPVLNSKIVSVGEPERGDVVVFRYPKNPNVDYIKRVIGLPGDKVGYFNKTIYINDKPVAQDVQQKQASMLSIVPESSELRYEYLGEHEHHILVNPERRLIEGETIVSAGEYFVMGDNRDNSNDSRFWGTVPEHNLVGKAFFIWMSWDWGAGGIVWERLGDSIN